MQTTAKETESLVPTKSWLSNLPYILACVALSAVPLLALAHDDMTSGNPPSCNEQRDHHPMRDNVFTPPPMGLPLFPPHIALTDEQQKKIFDLQHAQELVIFDQERIARKTMQELRALTSSDHFDSTKAKSLADANGKALAELIYLRTEIQAKIWAMLSDAQRKSLACQPLFHPELEGRQLME